MAEIDKLDRNSAIDLAKRMRNKARNIELNKTRMMTRLGTTAVSAVGAGAMGYYMGTLEHEWEQAGMPEEGDPRKLGDVIDIDLAVGLGVTALGIAMSGTKKSEKAGSYVEALGVGALAGWAYSRGTSAGKEAAASG